MNNNQNFSVEHVKSLLNSPLLQNQILHSLPASQAKALASLLHAESPLIQSIKQMSDNQFQYLSDQLQDAFTAPDRARKMCLEGKYREAIHCLHEAIDALARFPLPVDGPFQAACQYRSSSLLAIYHNLLSDCHWKLGDLSNAYQHEENAISFAQSISDWDTLAMLYHTQAIHRYLLGDYQQALSLCDTALETLKDQKDLWQLHKNILITISFISQELGQWDQAHIAAVEAVDLAEAAQDLKAFAQSLNCLACLNASTGENEPVDQLLSLALDAALDADDLPLSILILNNQAVETINRNESREDLDTALEDLNIAFYQAQKMDDPGLKAVTLKNLGAYYIELGQQDLARSHLEQALEILCQLGNRSQEIQVRVLLAKIAQQTNNFADAFCHLSDVIGTVEDIRLSLASESHRISYADEYAKPYDSLVSLLTQENRLDEAFLIAERARSQALRDLLLRQLAAAKQPSSGRLAGL
jgi:tetratricopeptide (TPR) repeat protein